MLNRRRRHTEGARAGLGITVFGSFFFVLAALTGSSAPKVGWPELVGVGIIGFGGVLFTTLGVSVGGSSLRGLRRPVARVWLDGDHLLWQGQWDRAPGRAHRSDIVEVGLSAGERAVVVRTVGGFRQVVSDLGTRAERVALAVELGAAIGARVAWPPLPPRWSATTDRGGALSLRRRSHRRAWASAVSGALRPVARRPRGCSVGRARSAGGSRRKTSHWPGSRPA